MHGKLNTKVLNSHFMPGTLFAINKVTVMHHNHCSKEGQKGERKQFHDLTSDTF